MAAFISKTMIVGDIIRTYPDAINILIGQGMHCIGCPSAQSESLENACFVHGLDPDSVTKTVNTGLGFSE